MALDSQSECSLVVVSPGEAWASLSNTVSAAAIAARLSASTCDSLEALDSMDAAVVVLPLPFGGAPGLAAVEKARSAQPGAAIVVLVAPGAEALAIEALRRGADHAHPTTDLDTGELARVFEKAATCAPRALAALSAARRRLEFLISATAAVTYSCKTSGDFAATFIGANVTALTGYQPEEFLAESAFWFDRVHPDDQPQVNAVVSRLLELGAHTWEYRFRCADGKYIWVHDAFVVDRDANGEPKEFIGYWVDNSARKEAEEALRHSESRFRALIESVPLGLLVHREGRIVYANPAFLSLLGYERVEDLIGMSSLEIVHPDDRAAILERQRRTYGGVHTKPREQRLLRRDGSDVVVEAEGIQLDFDGQPSAVVIVRDLTERHDLLARLAIADRMLSVGTLAAGVAHEINNPLTYVLTNALVLSEELPALVGACPVGRQHRLRTAEQAVALARDVHEGASRIRAVVRDLLSLARGNDENLGPVDVRHVLETATKMSWNEIRHRARLVNRIEETLPPVMANESRLVQVFLNLLINAAQAIPDGHAEEHEIRVTAKPCGSDVVVTVEDTGVGIPSSAIGRIFDPFFTTKAIGEGTGLGLSICHRIVKDLGGDVSVDSVPGEGTRFRVTLPVAAAAVETGRRIDDERVAPGERLRILVVDDQPAVGHSVALLLEPEADVVFETRAKAALARIAAGEHYDVVFCDLMMPEMNGMDFHTAIARDAKQLLNRIVFFTGGAFTQSVRSFLNGVPNRCLTKPIDLADLRSALSVAAVS